MADGSAFGAGVEAANTARLRGPGFLDGGTLLSCRGEWDGGAGGLRGACGLSTGFRELRLGAVSALPWFICGGVGACPVCTWGCCWVGKLRQAALGAAPSAPAEDWEGGCEAARVLPEEFARRGQSAPPELVLLVGGPHEVSPWAAVLSQKALRVVGFGVFHGCGGGSGGPAAIRSQPALPRHYLLVFKGCL